ncbi:phosphotransferase [Candidatus Woesearchaeota archaeon]|nr:phosphotransferase [Candidatus Woesearchaeota archaeon]
MNPLQRLLGRVSYSGLAEGNYVSPSPSSRRSSRSSFPSVGAVRRLSGSLKFSEEGLEVDSYRDVPCAGAPAGGAAGGFVEETLPISLPKEEDAPKTIPALEELTVKKKGLSPWRTKGVRSVFRGAGSMGAEETLPRSGYKSPSCAPSALPASLPALPRLPAEVSVLEQLLSLTYNLPVKITRIKELPPTRKQVKEVYFLINETNLSKVWVFKADPEKTRNELNAYSIIHGQGVLTGKPLGYQPSAAPYSYDIAILGGVVEHAGDPYEQMLENLALEPRTIFSTAQAIARTMADYQLKLTRVKEEFERYGITLLHADPGKEIRERLLAALGKTEDQASGLIAACSQLYSAQKSSPLISHGDCHLGNIVTTIDDKFGGSLSIQKFGVIDWGSLQYDTPFGDMQDFWLHHQRKAQKVCSNNYPYEVSALENTFVGALQEVAREKGYEVTLDENDSLIQSALWHLYEMYDPVRKEPADIEAKARVHAWGLWDSLEVLEQKRPYLKETAETIKREVRVLVGEKLKIS